MSLLFVHDTKIKKDEYGNYYTGGSYNEEVWERYKSVFSNITIIGRKEEYIYDSDYAEKNFNILNNPCELLPDTKNSVKSFINIKENMNKMKIIERNVIKNDYIIARLPSNAGNLAIRYAKKHQKPYLIEVVGCSLDTLWNYNYKGKMLAYFSFMKMRNKVKKATFTIYVTSNFLQKRYPTLGKSVNCSNVVLTDFKEEVLNNRLRLINNSNYKEKISLGTIGDVNVKYKGQEDVIKAIGLLNKRGYKNISYHLVGGGDQNRLIEIAEKYKVRANIKFYGTMSHHMIFEWLKKIDVYVQPSKTEGLPRALIEAMSFGLPAFGTKSGGIPELLESKFIINKNKKYIENIANMIVSFNKENMILQAKRNYLEAKMYDKALIEIRRKRFLKEFKNSLNEE
ncbi:glycosyltransferase [Alkalicoccus daliensis]|uniref:Glycosyltransferase involved in cell wall bisynthesis n=1 Tax=Alkalicoccus daliensis TaxID=745820 RepID=A0A1H0GG14_9BACI|nr:glycosyltransferase [Alkalicoccus daliensis]SDO05857.1 Glycosyltransferase involved in cell wall bisynthesis [Alkalicoccus daliensis]